MENNEHKKPVVLQILPELNQGGVEVGTTEIAEFLKSRGIKNYVASQGGRYVYNLKKVGVKHFTLPLKTKNPIKLYLNSKKLEKVIRENGINIVHARSRAPAWSTYWAAKRAGVKFLTTFHGTYGLGPLGIKKFYNKIMTYGALVIAISTHIKQHIIKNYHVDESKIRLIHRCVDVNRFDQTKISQERMIKLIHQCNIPNDRPIILSTGRLTSWKGQHLLIEALGKLPHKNFYCIFVGDAQGRESYVTKLKSLIEEYNLEGNVTFFEHTMHMPELMMLSSVIVSTALEPEAFGRMAAEGQAMGKIVLASNIGGSLDSVKDGITGRLFKSGDVQALTEALEWALNLKGKEKETLSANAIKNARENFTKELMCEKTLQVYHELLK